MKISTTIKFLSLILLFGLGIYLSLFYGGSESLKFPDLSSDFIFYQMISFYKFLVNQEILFLFNEYRLNMLNHKSIYVILLSFIFALSVITLL